MLLWANNNNNWLIFDLLNLNCIDNGLWVNVCICKLENKIDINIYKIYYRVTLFFFSLF